MSFQQVLDDAQHALEVEEALAFIDNFDLTTAVEGCAFSSHTSTASTGCDEPSTDFYEFAGINWGSTTRQQSSEPLQMQSLQPSTADPTPKPNSKKKTKKKKTISGSITAVSYTTEAAPSVTRRPRKHNRIEILKLREQVEELQAQYSELQQSTRAVSISKVVAMQHARQDGTSRQCNHGSRDGYSSSRAVATADTCPGRFDLVMEQYKQRQQSEALNRKLRDAVANQCKVTNSLQALLQKKVSPQDLDFLLEAPPRPAAAAANLYCKLASPRDLILAALYRSVESQFQETDRVCHGISVESDTRSVFTTSRTKQDAERGPSVELTMNAPMSSAFQLVGLLIWSRVMENKNSCEVRTPSELQHTVQGTHSSSHCSPVFHENRVQMAVPSRFGELQVDGVIVFRKVEEAHRIVITIASAYSVNGSRLVFRENGWIVVSKANDSSSSSSGRDEELPVLFQTFLRIHSEREDPRSSTGSSPFTREIPAPDEKATHLREFVTKALGGHMRQHMGELQKSLLSEVESIASDVVDFRCPQAGYAC